jgi:hypothetical protein
MGRHEAISAPLQFFLGELLSKRPSEPPQTFKVKRLKRAEKRRATPSFRHCALLRVGRRLAAARTGVSDCAGFAPNYT